MAAPGIIAHLINEVAIGGVDLNALKTCGSSGWPILMPGRGKPHPSRQRSSIMQRGRLGPKRESACMEGSRKHPHAAHHSLQWTST